MNRAEPSPEPVDEDQLAQMLACDALLNTDASGPVRDAAHAASAEGADRRARSRLLLLLRMLDTAEAVSDAPGDAGAGRDHDGTREGRLVLGRFEILDDLGVGGFGFVVRAHDRLLGREVALKMPLPERLLAPEDVHRFLREARAAARLDHPSIVRVHEAGELGPLGYFIASEFCEGPNLRRWLKAQGEPVPPRLAAGWIAALADAVQHAHDRGILHRDIKPDNVILTPQSGRGEFLPRLTDFGLAKVLEEAGEESRSDARVGTPRYMAPEQAAGRHREVGPATDVYALGATLYEVLTGRPPFRGETEVETLGLIVGSEPIPPRSLRPGLPRNLETICLKCLRKEPTRRYGTAAGLRDDLRRFLDGRPIVGRPVSLRERAWRWGRRRPAVVALIAMVVLLASGLFGGFAWWARSLEWHNRQLELQVARADREAREARNQRRLAEERRRLADRHNYAASLHRARRALDSREPGLAQDILHDLEPEPGAADTRGFAWHYLWRQSRRDFAQWWGHSADIVIMALSPDGRTLASGDAQGHLLIWDVGSGAVARRPRASLTVPRPGEPELSFSPDGRSIAVADRKSPHPVIALLRGGLGTTGQATRMPRLGCARFPGLRRRRPSAGGGRRSSRWDGGGPLVGPGRRDHGTAFLAPRRRGRAPRALERRPVPRRRPRRSDDALRAVERRARACAGGGAVGALWGGILLGRRALFRRGGPRRSPAGVGDQDRRRSGRVRVRPRRHQALPVPPRDAPGRARRDGRRDHPRPTGPAQSMS